METVRAALSPAGCRKVTASAVYRENLQRRAQAAADAAGARFEFTNGSGVALLWAEPSS